MPRKVGGTSEVPAVSHTWSEWAWPLHAGRFEMFNPLNKGLHSRGSHPRGSRFLLVDSGLAGLTLLLPGIRPHAMG